MQIFSPMAGFPQPTQFMRILNEKLNANKAFLTILLAKKNLAEAAA